MAASYPVSVKSFTALNPGDLIQDTDPEAAYDEITAIEQALLTTGFAHPLFPSTNNARDLGTSSLKWRDLYLAGVISTPAFSTDATNFVDSATQPRCVAYHNTTQTIATGSVTPLNLNSEDTDVGAMHDLVTNNSRITVPAGGDGFYLVAGQVASDGAVVSGNLYITKSGVNIVNQFFGSGQQTIRIMALVQAAAADYFELQVAQNAATSTVYGSATAAQAARLAVVKLW